MLRIIGHRGAKGLAPENTLASIEKALEYGVDEIEIDVFSTADGQIVLCHDRLLPGIGGMTHDIGTTTYRELLAAKPDLTTLAQAAAAVKDKAVLRIEIKPEADIQLVIASIKELLADGWIATNLTVVSFDQAILEAVKAALPEVPLGVNEDYWSFKAVRRARRLNTKHIIMNQKFLWFGFISAMSHRGYRLETYTLNDADQARRWAKHGLAGVCTDYPDRYVKSSKD